MEGDRGLKTAINRAALCCSIFVLVGAGACGDQCGDSSLVELVPLGAVQPAVDFGQRFVGVPVTVPIAIASQGTAPLTIGAVTVEGGAFVLASDAPPVAVVVGETVFVDVRFTAPAVGTFTGSMQIETNATNGPFDVALVGTGVADLECPPDESCRSFTFDRTVGACIAEDLAGVCDDDSLCTTSDHCDAGVCVGVAVECPLLGACGRGVCDPTLGCFNVPDPNLCDDDDPCTAEACDVAGSCSSAALPEGAACGEAECAARTCVGGVCTSSALPDGTPCDDRRICTAGDACNAGACAGVRASTEPVAGAIASTFGFGEALVMPDPFGAPADALFFTPAGVPCPCPICGSDDEAQISALPKGHADLADQLRRASTS